VSTLLFYPVREFALLSNILKLKNAFFVNFTILFGYLLILNREGSYVPSNNEFVYLVELAKLWNSEFLLNDWTFLTPSPSHLVFNLLFGPLTLLFPLEFVGWIGRIFSWTLILTAIFQLGKHFRIPLWMITVAILLWLFYRQSIVAGEWVLGTFEAKCIAYALLLFSLNGFMHQRVILPSILLGLAFSLHPLIGLWGALAVGLSLVVLRYPIDRIIKSGCYTVLFALPGLIPLLMRPLEGGTASSEAMKFVTLVVMPYHFDPFYFASSKRLLLLLAIILGFNWFHFRVQDKDHRDGLHFLIVFQSFLGLFFVLGFFARHIENYELLVAMPWRLCSVLLPLFFFLHLMSALQAYCANRSGKRLLLAGLLILAIFGNPVDVFADRVKKHYSMWTQEDEDVQRAFKWIAGNTPASSIIISPPWRNDSFYLSRRGQIASWWVPRFDRLIEWRERLESIAGDVSSVKPRTTKARLEHMTAHFNQLNATDIARLAEKYGAEYLVSSARYGYPVLFDAGTYKVYWLPREGLSASSS
jgi:hypothetical protein